MIALGGVDTGSIKAQEAARVVGISNNSGCASIACERLAMIGNDKEIVAVFEATSVRPVMKATVLITITNGSASPKRSPSKTAT